MNIIIGIESFSVMVINQDMAERKSFLSDISFFCFSINGKFRRFLQAL